MLLKILNLFAVIQICVAAKTYFNYDLTDAISKFTHAVKNEPSESLKSLMNQGQAIAHLYEHFKSPQLRENYLLAQTQSNSNISRECFRQITNLLGSLQNEELWSLQSN